jgi:cellulose synthase/poly-beta-1,6-N-acetylglucosamine synthase-like glycosyltransferase
MMHISPFLHIVSLILWPSLALYVLSLFILSHGLKRVSSIVKNLDQPFVSVIVPARNEEKNIEPCLRHLIDQSYPESRYEIIIVNDHSDDRTCEIIAGFASSRIVLLHSDAREGVSPKKAALHTGIMASRGEIILTTDADCSVPHRWIETLVNRFDAETAVVASWLVVKATKTLISKVEALDSFGYVLVGAATFGLGKPFLANGANLAYRKKVYLEVNGFDDIGQFGSGDDDLLLQKISRQTSWKCVFVDSIDACVTTGSNASWRGFWQQRLRWASKVAAYPRIIVLGEICIYLFYALLFFSMLAALFFAPVLFIAPAIKFGVDFLFLKKSAKRLGIRTNLAHFLLAEIIQMLYILAVGVAANWGRYRWKGRSYVRGRISMEVD